MESKRLDNAALAAGISPNYINAHGKPQSIRKRRCSWQRPQPTVTAMPPPCCWLRMRRTKPVPPPC